MNPRLAASDYVTGGIKSTQNRDASALFSTDRLNGIQSSQQQHIHRSRPTNYQLEPSRRMQRIDSGSGTVISASHVPTQLPSQIDAELFQMKSSPGANQSLSETLAVPKRK